MKPAIALSSVDLPQPDGPSSTKRSPANTSKPTRQVAVTRWSVVLYCSVTLSATSSGPVGAPAGIGSCAAIAIVRVPRPVAAAGRLGGVFATLAIVVMSAQQQPCAAERCGTGREPMNRGLVAFAALLSLLARPTQAHAEASALRVAKQFG